MNRRMRRQTIRSRRILNAMSRRRPVDESVPVIRQVVVDAFVEALTGEQVDEVIAHDVDKLRKEPQ